MSEDHTAYKNIIEQHRGHVRDGLLARQTRARQSGTKVTRSDSEHLAESPEAVVFGMGDSAAEFLIYPKSHLAADEWRNAALAFLNHLAPIIKRESETAGEGKSFDAAAVLDFANLFIVAHIPAVCELVFLWEPSLPRDEILHDLQATDTQLCTAFLRILGMAFPFMDALKAVERLTQGKATTAPTTQSSAG